MKIIIDPRTRISYASYYIIGLWNAYGKKNVIFSMKPFKELKQIKAEETFDQYFVFILKNNQNKKQRILIDYRDKNNINIDALRWTNVYAKVNYNSKTDEYIQLQQKLRKKIIPAGTNFGIRIWNKYDTLKYLTLNYLKSWAYLPVNFRIFFSGYNWQSKRETINAYKASKSDGNYVFHVSNFYINQENGEVINNMRSMFIRTCKNNKNCIFEGGLKSKEINQFNKKYSDVILNKYYPAYQYLKNIKKSAIVFNTPSAWECHGWKLGEYMAMGKAIISTPFVNEMPEKMIHGENIYFVETESEMEKAVNLLLSNNALRNKLERGAINYYDKWLKPEVVIRRIIEQSDTN